MKPLINQETIGQRIRIARKRADLTQLEFAEKIDVVPQQVSKYERERDLPTVKRLQRIAEVTNRPLYWFLLGQVGVRLDYPAEYVEVFWETARRLDEALYLRWKTGQGPAKEAFGAAFAPVPLGMIDQFPEPFRSDCAEFQRERERVLKNHDEEWKAVSDDPPEIEDRSLMIQLLQRMEEMERAVASLGVVTDQNAEQAAPRLPEPKSDHRSFGELAGNYKKKKRRGTSSA
jgi:transcriptional regulator with XRE-family HTH domain